MNLLWMVTESVIPGPEESATHMYVQIVQSCTHPTPPNCLPTIFPLKSRTQNSKHLCRKKYPWQQHIQSLLILFEKISLPIFFILKFLKKICFFRFTWLQLGKKMCCMIFEAIAHLGFYEYSKGYSLSPFRNLRACFLCCVHSFLCCVHFHPQE